MSRKTKMASITKLPSGAYRVQIRRKGRYASETFLRRDDAHRWARQAETRVDQGLAPNKSSVSRAPPLATSQASYNRYVRGRETAPSRAKAATLTTLKRDLDAWLVHYNTERPHLGYRNMGRRPIATVMSFVSQEG